MSLTLNDLEKKNLLEQVDFIFFNSKKESARDFAGKIDDLLKAGRWLSSGQISTLRLIYEKEKKISAIATQAGESHAVDGLTKAGETSSDFGFVLGDGERKKNGELNTKTGSKASSVPEWRCDYCSGNGVYLCTKKDVPDDLWAFRCHCSYGDSDRRKHIPQFKPGYVSQGYVWAK